MGQNNQKVINIYYEYCEISEYEYSHKIWSFYDYLCGQESKSKKSTIKSAI